MEIKCLRLMHDEVSITVLKNALRNIEKEKGSRITGLYFGSCGFCTEQNVQTILSSCESVKWIAGYQGDVEFVLSTFFDLLFFDIRMTVKNEYRKSRCGEERIISEVARRIRKSMSGVCASGDGNTNLNLDFSIYVRNSKARNGIKNLL